jgi:hypothetical protein
MASTDDVDGDDRAGPMAEDDGERGERQARDATSVVRAAEQADRLERHAAPAGDSVGVQRSGEERNDVGRDADVAHGESGDAGPGR